MTLVFSMVACGGNAQGDTETEAQAEQTDAVTTAVITDAVTEGEDIESFVEVASKGYALTSSHDTASKSFALDAGTSVAARFSVAENVSVQTFSFMLSEARKADTFTLSIYKWDTDYAKSTAGAPVFESTLVSPDDYKYYGSRRTFEIPEGTVGLGEWLYVLKGGEAAVNVLTTENKLSEDARVTIKESYQNGAESSNALLGYITYSAPDRVPEATADGYTKLSEGKAHVILIAGQSNAAGRSNVSALVTTMGGKNAHRYRTGYENIKISYMADDNVKVDFTPVINGQGAIANTYFGPELGLADYLSEKYPDEEFYIIKVAVSGSVIYSQWKENGDVYKKAVAHIENALGKLKDKGLDPEIFALCWMQGESDAEAIERAVSYDANMEDLLSRLENKFSANMAPNGMAFLDASIYHAYIWPYAGIVNATKYALDARSQNRYFLDTNSRDIETESEANDRAHYDSDDMIELGMLFGEGITKVLENAGYLK